jgi:hypothetical protein
MAFVFAIQMSDICFAMHLNGMLVLRSVKGIPALL